MANLDELQRWAFAGGRDPWLGSIAEHNVQQIRTPPSCFGFRPSTWIRWTYHLLIGLNRGYDAVTVPLSKAHAKAAKDTFESAKQYALHYATLVKLHIYLFVCPFLCKSGTCSI